MNQVEIIKAILAGEELEWYGAASETWRTFLGEDTPEDSLAIYLGEFMAATFRLKPKTVRCQTRAYLFEGRVGVWCSDGPQSQATTAFDRDGFRWLEETQEKEYTL